MSPLKPSPGVRAKKNTELAMVRSSAAEYLSFVAASGNSQASITAGVEIHTIEGAAMRVSGVAKTVADCFKFRNKIGLDVVLEALREARHANKASADELWRYAKINRVAKVMRPYPEAIA